MSSDLDFQRNNLERSLSPYLRQHAGNPVHWQEWNEQTLAYARETGKVILASVGYSTCHWCHVMAAEAFSDDEVARYLNRNFVCVKIDREQRPDIDRYLMGYLTATTGQGGWPLNAFLAPSGRGEIPRPFFAMTYASVTPRYGMPAFLEILRQILEFYQMHSAQIVEFDYGTMSSPETRSPGESVGQPEDALGELLSAFSSRFDLQYAGFGTGQKFPPHNTLLFLTYLCATSLPSALERSEAAGMAASTLDAMMKRGLHDHLQGGFFRYCVDRNWTIPHFEKMLYDQAMLLWVYSVASAQFHDSAYALTARSIIRCLRETFSSGPLFISAHDADTNHEEGATYIWSIEELESLLSAEEFDFLSAEFELGTRGNFEGRNHLVRRASTRDPRMFETIREKLLAARRLRPQPARDAKIVTSWNALAGVAFVAAHRYLAGPTGTVEADGDGYLRQAQEIRDALLERHFRDGRLHHSSIDGQVQPEHFLEDYAAMLLLLTTIHQLTGESLEQISYFKARVDSYRRNGHFQESENEDFVAVRAEQYDQPTPSSSALAGRALLEAAIILHEPYLPRSFGRAHENDFANLTALLQNGEFYVVETPHPIADAGVPVNLFQFPGTPLTTCYRGACTPGFTLR